MVNITEKIKVKSNVYLFILLTVQPFCSCKNKEEKPYSDILYEIHTLKEKVLQEGDTLSYNKLYDYYEYDNNLDELLTTSIILANRYNNVNAQNNTFSIITGSLYDNRSDKYLWDTASLEIAFSYLKRAVLSKNTNAISNLKFHVDNYNDELTVKIKNDKDLNKFLND